MLTPSPKLIFPNVTQARIRLPIDRVHGGELPGTLKERQGKRWQGKVEWRCSFTENLLCFWILLPNSISFSLLLLHSLFPPLFSQEALKWKQEKGLVEELLPDLSYRKVSHQNDVSSTALVSSFDEFEDIKEHPSPLTITQQEREGMGKENKLNTAHITWNLFALFRGFGGFEGHQSLHLCMLWDHSHTTVPLLHQLHVSVHLQGCLQVDESCWQWF